MSYSAMIISIGMMAFISVWTWLFKLPIFTISILTTLTFLGFCLYYSPKLRKANKEMKFLRQGLQGERVVADILDEIKIEGGYVLHDLVGGDFNIDHILLTRQGIFVIETKTWSKHEGKNNQIYYDGKTVKVDNYTPPKNPVEQAKANAKWIKNLVERTTGQSYPVRPVVVFPGWFVNLKASAKQANVWVLSPKMIKNFVKQEAKVLESSSVKLAFEHLKSFSRATK